MVRFLALLLLLPLPLFAATLQADQTVEVSVSPVDNAYLVGVDVRVAAPSPADLLAAGGTLEVLAEVVDDALLAGASVSISAPVGGDVRAAGGQVLISADVGGDIAALGGYVAISGQAGEMQVAGGSVEITGGAAGPVTVYGGMVSLAGEFAGDVRVVASDRVTLAEGTVIRGNFEYNAPQQAVIPASASVDGDVRYIGSSSFLPTAQQAQTFALAGIGILFVVRLVAAALAAAVLVGLFPALARTVALVPLQSPSRFMRSFLIGFVVLLATPIAVVLLLASFVGVGIAALVGAVYLLALLLSYVYAAAITGALLMRLARKEFSLSWKSALLGAVVLFALGLVPGLGFLTSFVFSAVALGSLSDAAYRFAFNRE